MTATVGALPVFSEEEKSVYRAKYSELKKTREAGALKMLISGANITIERVRKEWLADGSPTPRVIKAAKPEAKEPADDGLDLF